jgi:hypothetical protein
MSYLFWSFISLFFNYLLITTYYSSFYIISCNPLLLLLTANYLPTLWIYNKLFLSSFPSFYCYYSSKRAYYSYYLVNNSNYTCNNASSFSFVFANSLCLFICYSMSFTFSLYKFLLYYNWTSIALYFITYSSNSFSFSASNSSNSFISSMCFSFCSSNFCSIMTYLSLRVVLSTDFLCIGFSDPSILLSCLSACLYICFLYSLRSFSSSYSCNYFSNIFYYSSYTLSRKSFLSSSIFFYNNTNILFSLYYSFISFYSSLCLSSWLLFNYYWTCN